MRIAVCDDEEAQCILLSGYLKEWGKSRDIVTDISCFSDAETFLFDWEERAEDCLKAADLPDQAEPAAVCGYDLLVLDIEMGAVSGMELAKKIRRENEEIPILFITGYERYMAQGYEVAALHYLMKPVRREKLFQVLDGLGRKRKPEEKLVFPTPEGHILLPAERIWYVEAMGHDCVLCAAEDKRQIRMSMGEAVRILGGREGFVQCHRSYLVNLRHISAIVRAEIVMDDGTRLPISRRMQKEVNQAFIRNYR